jgi:hypothetical protein
MEGLSERYRETGQPVIIDGSMETGSYVPVGVADGAQTFFSTAHGSGRTMSRTQAKRRGAARPCSGRGPRARSSSSNSGDPPSCRARAGRAANGEAIVDLDLTAPLTRGLLNEIEHSTSSSFGRHLTGQCDAHRHVLAPWDVNGGQDPETGHHRVVAQAVGDLGLKPPRILVTSPQVEEHDAGADHEEQEQEDEAEENQYANHCFA